MSRSEVVDAIARLQAVVNRAAAITWSERQALAAQLRCFAAVLEGAEVSALAGSLQRSSITDDALARDAEEWTLAPPHVEEMPWKLLLSQWWLLEPCDQVALRGACSGLRVGSLASFFLEQHPSIKYSKMPIQSFEGEHEIDHGLSDEFDELALACARQHYFQLRFIRDLQARCAWAEAKALAVSEILGPERRGEPWHERRSKERAVLDTLLPGDPRIVCAARRLAEQCPEVRARVRARVRVRVRVRVRPNPNANANPNQASPWTYRWRSSMPSSTRPRLVSGQG